MIKFKQVTFSYPETKIFSDFSWQINSGEIWSVLGPSGCGKSTLLYLLSGIRYPSKGEVLIHNELITKPRPKTGLILQSYGLLPWETVEQNISLGLRIRSFYGPDGKHAPTDDEISQIEERTNEWINRLGLEQAAGKYPGQISGGQRQRTAIARTLVLKPDLLLMDEPFGSLDSPTRKNLQQLVLQLQKEEKLTTIIVTHSVEEAAFLGKSILILGNSPHTQPDILHNPQAGDSEYLNSTEYAELCRLLQSKLEQNL